MKYVLVDTMVFLHFPPLEDIDWTEHLGHTPVQLIVCDPVVRELDKHKDSHGSAKIRDRARRALRRIESWAESDGPVPIREGVTLELWLAHPPTDWTGLALDATWLDDQILAVGKWLHDSRDHEVLIVSDDTGPRLKARRLGMTALGLPDGTRLPPDEDPSLVENRKLRARLAALSEQARPDLKVRFKGGEGPGDRKHLEVRPERSPGAMDELVLERLEAQRALHAVKGTAPADAPFGGGDLSAHGEVPRYNRELEEYFEQYEAYLRKLCEHEQGERLHFRLTFQLCNTGRAPASDIDVAIHIPDGPHVSPPLGLSPPMEPALPRPPRTLTEIVAEMARPPFPSTVDYGAIMKPVGPPIAPNVSGPRITEIESHLVEYSVRRLKHDYCADLGTVELWYSAEEFPQSMTLEYRVHTADLPEEQSGELHLVFTHSTE